MDRVSSSMKQVSNPLPKVLSRRAGGGGGLEAERESFERAQVRGGTAGWGRVMPAGGAWPAGGGVAYLGGGAREVAGVGSSGGGKGVSRVGGVIPDGRGLVEWAEPAQVRCGGRGCPRWAGLPRVGL